MFVLLHIIISLTGLKTFWWTGCVNVGGWVLWKRTCYTHWLSTESDDILTDRTQCVNVGGEWSEDRPVMSGVPLRSVLCPTLFDCLNKLHARNSRMLHQDFCRWHYNYIIIILKIIIILVPKHLNWILTLYKKIQWQCTSQKGRRKRSNCTRE